MSGDDDVVLQGADADSGLDKHRPPPIDKMPSMQEWGWRISTGQVVSDEQQWAARAAAEPAADEPFQTLRSVRTTLRGDYSGKVCAEVRILFEDLSKVVGESSGWCTAIDTQIRTLRSIAADCRAAGDVFQQADQQNSATIST